MAGNSFGQTGITISPSKLYYKFPYGGNGTQKIILQNPNDKDLEIGVSINDWEYDSLGNNVTSEAGTLKNSCSNWIRIAEGTYFVLKPYERKEIEVALTAPSDADASVPVHTSMLYFTQLNPGGGADAQQGANVRVTVKMGVKVYHTFVTNPTKDVEITDFKHQVSTAGEQKNNVLEMQIDNLGDTWVEGKVKVEMLNTSSGKKTKLDAVDFYQLPGDKRIVKINIPDKTKGGKYNATAVVSYGDRDELKVAELDFELSE